MIREKLFIVSINAKGGESYDSSAYGEVLLMTYVELSEHLEGVESWHNAGEDARYEFAEAMTDKQYGYCPTLNAWGWFYEGWLRRFEFDNGKGA